MTPVRPTALGFARFATAIGECAIAWSELAVLAIALPARQGDAAGGRVARHHPQAREASPGVPSARAAAAGIADLLAGRRRHLREIELDLRGLGALDRRAYAAAREVAPGQIVTYGELAARIGDPGAAREVGAAMARNPFPIVVPCHRVVAANGRLGGFSAPGGTETKRRLLALEGRHADVGLLALGR